MTLIHNGFFAFSHMIYHGNRSGVTVVFCSFIAIIWAIQVFIQVNFELTKILMTKKKFGFSYKVQKFYYSYCNADLIIRY